MSIEKPDVLSDEMLEDVVRELDEDLSLNKTQAAYARQIISDLWEDIEPLIQQAKREAIGEAFDKLQAINKIQEILKAKLNDVELAIQQAKKEIGREIEPLIDKLFEALDHADFSNGIEAHGIDEGRVRANEHIQQLKRDWQSLKSKYLKEEHEREG